jgi:hypothetical protein
MYNLQGDFVVDKVIPILNDEELNQAVEPILQEYLEHCDTREVEVRAVCLHVSEIESFLFA